MPDMNPEAQEKLAACFTAHSTELLVHLPYLLQDLYQLGGSPDIAVELLRDCVTEGKPLRVLDLCCGKGAISVALAENLHAYVKGVDIIPEFIQAARFKADERSVYSLCNFTTMDVNRVIDLERGWDAVIFCAAGNVLGTPAQTLQRLAATVHTGGYILLDESYLCSEAAVLRTEGCETLTLPAWQQLFAQSGLYLVRMAEVNKDIAHTTNLRNLSAVTIRAEELAQKYPAKQELFKRYVQNKCAEIDNIQDNLVNVVWLLQKGR